MCQIYRLYSLLGVFCLCLCLQCSREHCPSYGFPCEYPQWLSKLDSAAFAEDKQKQCSPHLRVYRLLTSKYAFYSEYLVMDIAWNKIVEINIAKLDENYKVLSNKKIELSTKDSLVLINKIEQNKINSLGNYGRLDDEKYCTYVYRVNYHRLVNSFYYAFSLKNTNSKQGKFTSYLRQMVSDSLKMKF